MPVDLSSKVVIFDREMLELTMLTGSLYDISVLVRDHGLLYKLGCYIDGVLLHGHKLRGLESIRVLQG